MKKLLFIGIVALMVQSLGAVTLPSTSYSPYAGGSASTGTEQSLLTSGTMVTGSYVSLGDYPSTDVCTTEEPGVPPEGGSCEGCCDSNFNCTTDTECWSLYYQCVNSCEQGGSLPLDGGLSILLILSLAGGAVKAFRVKRDK